MKIYTFILSLLLSVFTITASAVEKNIGYCSDEISSNVYPVGVSGQQTYLSAAVKFPASKMRGLVGNKITKVRIGIGSGMKNVKVWIRVGSLDTLPVVLQRISGTIVDGWNEVTLDTPYEIDGSNIYVGYSGTQPYDKLCIWLDGEENANATFINDGSWVDYYGYGWGALLIQATVSGDNFANADLSVASISLDSTYYKSGSQAKFDFTIENNGKQDFPKYSYSYRIDNGEAVSETVNEAIASSGKVTVSKALDLTGIAEGKHKLTVFLEQDKQLENGDEILSNDTLSEDLLVYTNQYDRNILLEQFTTIACVNCPYGDAVLNRAVSGRSNVAWVAHHVGYNTDELTVNTSKEYMDFGVTGAPMAMVSRTYLPVEQNQTTPVFSIGYTDSQYGATLVDAMIDYLCTIPTFVNVKVSCDYDETSRLLTVKANGECNGIYTSLQPDSRLTVFLTEDNVTAKHVQTGTTDDYTHHHVLRSVLTSTFGDEVEWNGNAFEATYTATLDTAWIAADIKAVAFISKPYTSNNVNNAEVLNVGTGRITNLSSINGVNTSKPAVGIVDGRLVVEGDYDSAEVYSINGAKVDASNIAHGLYIIKVRTKSSDVTTSKCLY